jgi:phosphoserine phosphatase
MMKRAAIVYDFDGTLARGNIQEHSFIRALDMEISDFWQHSNSEAERHDADQILTYMREMLLRAKKNNLQVTRESLTAHGADVPFFEGVETWFDRMNTYGEENGLALQHYIISSGIRQMIRGCAIAHQFAQIYASSFIYDDDGVAVWPALSINYTTKTQYLFRINKGIDNCWDNKAINTWIPAEKRSVPFQNMIFVGDGETDIPSMKMVRHQGGFAVAVFDPDRWESLQERIYGLIAEDRANFVAPADYSQGSQLDVTVRGLLGRIANQS